MSKNHIILIMAALICSLVLTVNHYADKLSEAKKKANTLEKTIDILGEKLDTFHIAMGDTIQLHAARVKAMDITKKNLENRCGELLRQLSLKPKEVHHYSETSTIIHDTVTVLAEVDTFGGIKARYADEFANIGVAISKDRKALFDYSIKDSLTIFNHQKRHSILFGLIKWNSTEKTTVVNHNPNAVVTNFQSVNIIK